MGCVEMKKLTKYYRIVVVKMFIVITIVFLIIKMIDINIYSENNLYRVFYKNEYVNVFLEGRVSKWDAEKLIETLKVVPDKILQDFNKDGFEIILTDVNISEKYYKGKVIGIISGLFVEEDKKIYISRKSNYINYATIHEIGHYFDFKNNWSSVSKEFINIYESEKEKLKTVSCDDHYKSNSKEFFATSFKEFLKNPKRLKKYTPLTYEYIKKLFDENK